MVKITITISDSTATADPIRLTQPLAQQPDLNLTVEPDQAATPDPLLPLWSAIDRAEQVYHQTNATIYDLRGALAVVLRRASDAAKILEHQAATPQSATSIHLTQPSQDLDLTVEDEQAATQPPVAKKDSDDKTAERIKNREMRRAIEILSKYAANDMWIGDCLNVLYPDQFYEDEEQDQAATPETDWDQNKHDAVDRIGKALAHIGYVRHSHETLQWSKMDYNLQMASEHLGKAIDLLADQ